MKSLVTFLCLLVPFGTVALAAEPAAPAYADQTPQRYHLTKRASEIDPRTKEHPEIDFVFKDKDGKVADLEHAVVDTRVAPRGRLVIWLMNYNAPLFDRLGDYGLHAIQVSYANKWFGIIPAKARDDGTSLGQVRLEATTGTDASPLCDIPKPDGMMERAYQLVKYLAREHPAGRWEQFIAADGQGLRWDRVIISGSSHGATSAARFAVAQRVDRVVMFCGPRDQLESWQGFPSATPANRFFGFSHVLDGGWTGDHYCRSWQMLGLHAFGPDHGCRPERATLRQHPSPHHAFRREGRCEARAQFSPAGRQRGEKRQRRIHPRSRVEIPVYAAGGRRRRTDPDRPRVRRIAAETGRGKKEVSRPDGV